MPYGICPKTESYTDKLSNGLRMAFEASNANPEGTTYIRLVNESGGEVAYWNFDEWEESPIEVMGAICGGLVGSDDFLEPKYYQFTSDVVFPEGIEYEKIET